MRDFGSATEAMRIIDLFALQVFANNLDRGNFRVLQHNPFESGSKFRASAASIDAGAD
jgi:hypothetical protein